MQLTCIQCAEEKEKTMQDSIRKSWERMVFMRQPGIWNCF